MSDPNYEAIRRKAQQEAEKALREVAVAVCRALQAGARVPDVWDEVARGARNADYENMARSAQAAADAASQ
jgi:hypothetical protein